MDEPVPPRPVPPAPPRPEWMRPAAAPAPAGGPMIDFFQRRVEALERELAMERERAQSAQNLLARQEALKGEVDAHLKAVTEQLKREKNERDNEESRAHARGRIDSLEKRLDEMNATFAQLLKEAVAQREQGPSGAALEAELAALRGALKDGLDGISRWRAELREISALAPKIAGLAERRDEKAFEEGVNRRLDEFSTRLARALEDWRSSQDAERAALDQRLAAAARERANLARDWETQSRALREEQFKERVAREVDVSRQIAALSERFSALAAGRDEDARASGAVRQDLRRVLEILTATPKAKDEVISGLETENDDLRRMLADRQDALRRFAEERRGVEKSMGDGLLKLTAQVEDERARVRAAEAESARRLGEIETLTARLADRDRALADRDDRVRQLLAERDELAKALAAEDEKTRAFFEERRQADAAANARLEELRKRLEEESERRGMAEGAAADARRQMAAMSEQAARALQERDSVLARHAAWDQERQALLEQLRKKDEMISILSTTFRGALKKGG